ncbi:MAG: PilZ domain-containing protein [Vicinamibacterales bacterium]
MSDEQPERQKRRSPRVAADACYLRLPLRLPLLVRDLSVGGAMLVSPVAISPGSQGTLRTILGSRPFETRVDLCRAAPAEFDARKTTVSVTFKDMRGDASQVLNHFLTLAAREPNS